MNFLDFKYSVYNCIRNENKFIIYSDINCNSRYCQSMINSPSVLLFIYLRNSEKRIQWKQKFFILILIIRCL